MRTDFLEREVVTGWPQVPGGNGGRQSPAPWPLPCSQCRPTRDAWRTGPGPVRSQSHMGALAQPLPRGRGAGNFCARQHSGKGVGLLGSDCVQGTPCLLVATPRSKWCHPIYQTMEWSEPGSEPTAYAQGPSLALNSEPPDPFLQTELPPGLSQQDQRPAHPGIKGAAPRPCSPPWALGRAGGPRVGRVEPKGPVGDQEPPG